MNAALSVSLALGLCGATGVALAQPPTEGADPVDPEEGIVAAPGVSTSEPAPAPAPPVNTPAAPEEPAQNEASTEDTRDRVLGGHRFILPNAFESPLMVKTFVFTQGLGMLSFSAEDADGNDVSGKIVMLSERLSSQIGLFNRVAAFADVTAFAGVGGDLKSVLLYGGFADLDLKMGVKARAFTIDSIGFQLSTGAAYRYNQSLAVVPAAILAEAVAGEKPKVLQKSRAEFIDPFITLAWGFRMVGVQLSVTPSFSMHSDRAAHQLSFGASGTFDVGSLVPFVPVAANIEYVRLQNLQGPAEPDQSVTAGVFYSGRVDLQLGLRYSMLLTKGYDLKAGTLVMAYFF